MLRYWSASQWLNVAGSKTLVQPLGARLAMRVKPATNAPNGGPSRASAFIAPSLSASCAVVGAIGGLSWVAVMVVGLRANDSVSRNCFGFTTKLQRTGSVRDSC